MFASGSFRLFAIFLSLITAFSIVTIDTAEARRGGSFGSRGIQTFRSVPATKTSPNVTAPVNRSVTSPSAAPVQPRSGLFGGGLLQGLFLGGLFGLFMGHGFGGFGGIFSLLFQILLIAGLVWFFFGRRRFAAAGGAPVGSARGYDRPQASSYAGKPAKRTFEVSNHDLDVFEERLGEVQAAFSHEDEAALRRLTTPEMLGHLSAELRDNADRGLRNEVLDVKMLGGSVAEAWSEGSRDYATVALRYESRDVTRERSSGRVVAGSEDLSETTEIWTFVRENRGDWTLSAIQEA